MAYVFSISECKPAIEVLNTDTSYLHNNSIKVLFESPAICTA